MSKATECLSDAAQSVIQKTLTRLKDQLSALQFAAIEQLASEGNFFDIEAFVLLAETTAPTEDTNHGD